MTLIALTINHGNPVLMGDILISHPDGNVEMPLPTFIDGNSRMFSGREDLKPAGFVQKLYVINDRFCVALAGNVAQMSTFLKRIKLYCDGDPQRIDIDDLFNYIGHLCKDELPKISVIAITSTHNGGDDYIFSACAGGDFHRAEHPYYEEVIAAGSGARQFIDFVGTNPRYMTDLKGEDSLLYMNQSLLAYWLGQEVSRGETLAKLWGAGYEMVTFKGGRFVKMEEYSVVFKIGEFGKNIPYHPAPFSTMFISYVDDLLLIRVILRDREITFYVPSIIEEREKIEIKAREPKHEILMVIYVLTDVDENVEYTPCIIRPRNINEWGKSPVIFSKENGRLVIGTDPKSDQIILEQVLRIKGNPNT